MYALLLFNVWSTLVEGGRFINGNQIHPTLEKVWVFFGSHTLHYEKISSRDSKILMV
ncbi:hypothetical protein Ngar_c07270 [Candidatus Nitrososphaera gargensis Ga9.2]|uniref:Uncharacterized protein n=1 Tax=Nitrososphaera gargensis (strain Ga9.2) TaxID=1237085 RepID=K0IDF7_NITGG|nr:hypothetical protein Ngar_c07270 [Candidatus Nitrososphaera gargensis Ga9.2]